MPAACSALTMSRNSRRAVAAPRVGGVRREEGDGAVAPVLRSPRAAVAGGTSCVERDHRHQLDGRDAQPLQVGNLLGQAANVPGLVTPAEGGT